MKVSGQARKALARIYHGMLSRCSNPNHNESHNYMGRGITVCERWRESFDNFAEDMGERPAGMSIDRIDNDKGYSLDNCRWATPREQSQNRRGNRNLTFNGVTKCAIEWSRETGIRRKTIIKRIEQGWSVERALTEPASEFHKNPPRPPRDPVNIPDSVLWTVLRAPDGRWDIASGPDDPRLAHCESWEINGRYRDVVITRAREKRSRELQKNRDNSPVGAQEKAK